MTKKILKATHGSTADHPLKIGNVEIPCYVLEDGTRVLSQRGLQTGIGMSKSGASKSGEQRLAVFVGGLESKGIEINDLTARIQKPIEFYPPSGGRSAYGYEATILADICDAVFMARKAKALQPNQIHIAEQCEILMRGFARVGIIALVDAATGYEEIRDRKALQAILDRYLRKELAAWAKRFPDEFYKEMFRLRDWNWSYLKRPAYVGKLTNDVVYERITAGLLDELKKRAPKDDKGKRKGTLQQLFTDDIGHPALAQHLHAVTGLMRAAGNWDGFYRLLQRSFPKKNDQLTLMIDD